jgi:hypothetical protein
VRRGRKRAIFALAHQLQKTVFVLIDRGDYYRNASIDILAPAPLVPVAASALTWFAA